MTAWRESALCAQTDPNIWYPEEGMPGAARTARRLCSMCPVQYDCLEDGLHEEWGIWGGLGPEERRKMLGLPTERMQWSDKEVRRLNQLAEVLEVRGSVKI